MKTTLAKAEETKRAWFVVDANDLVLGRAASRIASILRGKHKPIYTPYNDTGDFVIIINAEKIKVTGRKEDDKLYYKHTGYIGHLKVKTLAEMRKRKPEQILRIAIRGMLPKGPLGRKMITKLKIYKGTEHPHKAQKPEPLNLKTTGKK